MSVCAIVGSQGAGKTLLVEQLLAELRAEGRTVAYIKHAHHDPDLDRPGSDSWRAHLAGAAPVSVLGPGERLTRAPRGREDLAGLLAAESVDLVLLEGFSASAYPKVRVTAAGQTPREVAPPVLADLERSDAGFGEAALAEALAVLRGLAATSAPEQVVVHADGEPVPLGEFPARAVAATLRGLASALRGVEDPRTLTISVRREAGPAGEPPGDPARGEKS